MKLLLHTCCAPCLTTCILGLEEENLRPGIFWYNPNIHPFTEYQSRCDSLVAFIREERLDLIMEDEYGLRSFIQGFCEAKDFDEMRCDFCYKTRLERSACQAAKNNYQAFSSSLLCSPYQNHDLIRQIAEECAIKYGVDFFYRDFRPWFREGQKKARAQGSYMQKYCGCIFSEEERHLQKGKNVLRQPLPPL